MMVTSQFAASQPPLMAAQVPAVSDLRVVGRPTLALLTWTAVPGATTYVVQVARDAAMSNPIEQRATGALATVTGLAAGTTYFARVAVAPPAGQPAPWGKPSEFATAKTDYAIPAPRMDVTTPTSTSLAAAWGAVALGQRYQLQWSLKSDLSSASEKVVTATDAVIKDIKPDTEYYMRVRAVSKGKSPLSYWSDVVKAVSPAFRPLTVGSFNIRNAGLGDKRKGSSSWSKRRTVVASTILGESPDVVGLQEASWTRLKGRKTSQLLDLVHLLGSKWKLTNYAGHAGSEGTRLLYDSSKLTLVRAGFHKLAGSNKFGAWRYASWGVFTQKSTGKKFFVINTHLTNPKSKAGYNARKREARQIVGLVSSLNSENLPVFIIGDFNSSKFRTPDNAPYRVITGAGYIDPLDNTDRYTGPPRGIAEARINANLFTYNDYKRVADHRSYSTGVMVDQIFVTKMRVLEWETVARINAAGRFIGTIPSDHNMIRTTVYLP